MIWPFVRAFAIGLVIALAVAYLMRPLPYQPRSPEVQGVCLLWDKAGYPCEKTQRTNLV